jgi:Uma2 family endonuclease
MLPDMVTATKLLTVAEFELMPDPEVPGKQELLDGELIQLPPAKNTHNTIVRSVFMLLHGVVGSRARVESGFQMPPHTWLQPDVSVMWPDQSKTNDYLQGSPMIAVEVVSPGNSAEEINRKTRTYLKHGAAEVWIVYPRTRMMTVHKATSVEEITDTYTCESIPVVVNLSELLG